MADQTESVESSAPAESGAPEYGAAGVRRCPNCGSRAIGHYCAVCGQRARGLHIPLRVFAAESLGSVFRVDSRLWQTLATLVRRPGLLTLHYLQGKRVRYIGPLRLYLSVSFVVFFLLAISQRDVLFKTTVGDADSTAVAEAATGLAEADIPAAAAEVLEPARADTSAAAGPAAVAGRDSIPFESGDDSDSLDAVKMEGLVSSDSWLGQLFMPALEEPERTRERFSRRLPWVFFFIMPVFASTLQVLYRRRESYYVPHLIFTLHFFAAGFLLYAVGLMVSIAFGTDTGLGIAILAAVFYLFVALRRVYREGRVRTLMKHISLILVYCAALMVGTLLVVAFALLTA